MLQRLEAMVLPVPIVVGSALVQLLEIVGRRLQFVRENLPRIKGD